MPDSLFIIRHNGKVLAGPFPKEKAEVKKEVLSRYFVNLEIVAQDEKKPGRGSS